MPRHPSLIFFRTRLSIDETGIRRPSRNVAIEKGLAMKFMMLVIADPTLSSEEETPITVDEWVQEYDGSGVRLDGERLRPPSAAKTVRRRNGKVTVTD